MHLMRMRFGGVPPFTESVEFKFDERVNLFIGPNASGKSTLLLMLADRIIGPDKNGKRPISQGMGSRGLLLISDDQFDKMAYEERPNFGPRNVLSDSENRVGIPGMPTSPEVNLPVVHIGSVREELPGISGVQSFDDCGETAAEVLAGPFSGLRVQCAFDMLVKELWLEKPREATSGERGRVMKAVELADTCSKVICDEVITDTHTHNYIPGHDVRDYLSFAYFDRDDIKVLRGMGIKTNDPRNFGNLSISEEPSYAAYPEDPDDVPIYLGHLSSGTEGTLLWIRWLAFKMVHHYEYEEGWERKPAILLIDEIENHLHPTWQRRVIPALLEHFPGLQIFATTHSPFVVAGLKAGQVHLLNRDANGVVTATTNERDVIGWTADEILRTMMGVDDPTDDATAKAAAELRELRNEGPGESEDAEEKRQQRMLELRQLVDRDLLAGGPMAAQRELFEQNLMEILEEHRRSQGLSQE